MLQRQKIESHRRLTYYQFYCRACTYLKEFHTRFLPSIIEALNTPEKIVIEPVKKVELSKNEEPAVVVAEANQPTYKYDGSKFVSKIVIFSKDPNKVRDKKVIYENIPASNKK